LVLLVSDSEYNHVPGTQPIPGSSGIYLVSPGALSWCALLRATPPPLGGGKAPRKKRKKKDIRRALIRSL
jgi:hypothetical protein